MNDSLGLKITNQSNWPLPTYATIGSSGLDLRANIENAEIMQPMQRLIIGTGIFIQLPENFEAQIRSRSGMAIKQGIVCLNSPGTIDSDYRGEIKIILINFSNEIQTIFPGDRIAQMTIAAVQKIHWIETVELNETNRNDGGFGHTGKK